MGHDDLLGEDLFASELDDDLLVGADLPEEDVLDPFLEDDELAAEDDELGLGEDEDDIGYDGGYNPDEWN
ncbi:MAG: hypothetical protein QG580_159 [Patescibacteria group bacterium]|nr:hypothetical protein [Patescibacteria group bacterium]